MADRPILFSGPMIRALLAGRKTQTRRLALLPDATGQIIDFVRVGTDAKTGRSVYEMKDASGWHVAIRSGKHLMSTTFMPRVAVGDRLWVREGHAFLPRTAYRGSMGTGTIAQREHPTDGYTAAVFREGFDRSGRPPWRPSIHMPRWASRITLIVESVKVERLQDISEADAIAEGTREPSLREFHPSLAQSAWSERTVYSRLWTAINGPGSWEANPWVTATTFRVVTKNIDTLRKENST